jgi:2'-5' RNA ligase
VHYFIALDFDESVRKTVREYAEFIEGCAHKARIVNEEHVHLTVLFLGSLNEAQVQVAKQTLNAVDVAEFDLTFNHISKFTPRKGGDIFFIGTTFHTQLNALYSTLKNTLEKKHFDLDERPFTPHVTLARGVKITEEESGRFNTSFKPFKTTVKSMSLLCSLHEEGRLVYKLTAKKYFHKA